ncbi:serine hydrolase domain-containing protein [Aspergillus undulatus]|uniref:serine hydrolase domain-containing protein n=1 Tax=Aspergillus undulatus TaxID=1810928 RepID=UPI003CCDFBD6
MAQVHGHCDQRFSALRDVFADHLKSGKEIGASVCITVNGETAVDLWGGYATPDLSQPWTRDTIAPVWSISKTISALSVLLLVDRGQLHLDDPVAKYWPAFDTDDKRAVKVKHFLSHTAGLPGWDPPISISTLLDEQPLATEKLVAQTPWWEPGTASGYHLVSQGLLIGELVKRVSGKPLPQFVADEFATPLSADFHLGLQDEKEWGRIAELTTPTSALPPGFLDHAPDKNHPMAIAIRAMRGVRMDASHAGTPAFRRCGIGSMGGLSNARGFNKILEIITNRGTINGHQYLKPSTIDLIFEKQAEGPDLVLGLPLKMGMGFGLDNKSVDWLPEGKVCFWGGYGGSLAIMDLERGVTFTYAMNRMATGTLGNSCAEAYVRALYHILNEEGRASL